MATQQEWEEFRHVEIPFVMSQVLELLQQMQSELEPQSENTSVPSGPLDGLKLQHKHSKPNTNPMTGKIPGVSLSSATLKSLALQGIIASSGMSSSAAPSVCYSSSLNSWMDVSLQLNGCLISNVSIDSRVQRHQRQHLNLPRKAISAHHVVTRLKPDSKPVVVDQLYFVLVKTKEMMRSVEIILEPGLDEIHLVKYIESVTKALEDCRSIMSTPNRNAFPQALLPGSSTMGCVFDPPLPPESHIDFSVMEDELHIVIYELHTSHSPDKHPSMFARQWMQPIELHSGKIFSVESQNIYVDDHVEVRFKVHSLQWVLENIYESYNWLISILAKLRAFVELLEMEKISSKQSVVANESETVM